MDLDNKEWKVFVFNKVFNITSTSSGIDKNKLITKKGNIPYLTRSDKENGYNSFICEQDEKYKKDSSNVITIGLDTQTVFYQPHEFYTGQNIQVLSNDQLNKEVAHFLIPLIKGQIEKLNWGSNGATLERLRRSKMLLPIATKGESDYAFMEQYMRAIAKQKIKLYNYYIKRRIEQLKDFKEVARLENKEWGEFKIKRIFKIKSGKRLTKADMKKGAKPFIGATGSNNGITEFISNTNASEDYNVLGVNYNGSVVENFYHPYKALFSDDVKRFSFKEVKGNKHLFLFVKGQILKQKEKYQYGYKFGEKRMNNQKLLLPINQKKEPDYAYMENYMKQIEFKKLNQYLAFTQTKV